MKKIRKEIDTINDQISSLLLKRMRLVKKIGKHKKENGMKIIDKKREMEILNKLTKRANNKAEKDCLADIFKSIIKNSRRVQRQNLK